ncbi:MAG TPA: ATP-binding protein [Thermoanaerobaculia bacterium]|nr:ATP-binding protein [Thermoanaerobaculia bacterium]
MFRVENADFIAEKLAAELLPNQEFREVLKNALQAVERRMRAEGVTQGGRIEFDVDWHLHQGVPGEPWYLSCSDNGDGMNRSQLERYTTTLAVQGADQKQSIRGNQGMGLKISGPTRHKEGVLIRSLQDGERTMVQVGWNGQEYDLIPLGEHDEKVVEAAPESFPDLVNEQDSGAVVTFLGNAPADNTFAPENRARTWLLKYLNTRFFRLSHNGIEVIVRVPTGGPEDWPNTPDEAKERMRGEGGRSFNLTKVNGTAELWDKAADRQGEGWRGVVSVPGNAAAGVPPADVHWWVLPVSGTDVSSRTASGGSLAVLFDNELHDWRTSNQANPFFARLGVLFGKTRIAFVIEPQGPTVASDFARAHVLIGGTPVFESDSWLVWAEQFRQQLPERIKQTMAEEQARLEVEDPDRARRIRDRLQDVMQMLRPRRFRRQPSGSVRASGEVPGAGGGEEGEVSERPIPRRRQPGPRPGRGRGVGAVLSRVVDDEEGDPANEVFSILKIDPRWVTEQEAESLALVNGNGYGLRDRAAALAGEDGRTANILLLNRNFRGFQAILAAVSEWANPEGDDEKAAKIKASAEEWIEQKMIEAVQGLRQLDNGTTWLTQHYDEAMSPVALTAAFMADRYHTLAEVKRAVGPLRQTARAAATVAGSLR